MIIGSISLEKILAITREPEKLLAREISTSLYEVSELKTRFNDNDAFIVEVLNGPKIMLIGSEHGLRRALE